MSDSPKQVVVVGAGVIGLTTAVLLQEKGGYAVTVVAEILPSDPKTIKYTSSWAGAHHVSHASHATEEQKIDQETFDVMWKLSEAGGAAEGCFMRLPQTEYYHYPLDNPHPLSWMPDFQVLPNMSLRPGTLSGVSFTTFTINTPVYLNYLLSRFLAAGGAVSRGTVQHIDQVVEGGGSLFTGHKKPSPPAAIVVCAGIGARLLGGIEDKDVHPIRGQTLVIRAPWIKFGRTISSQTGLWTYIIPRRNGDVVVGGTKAENDWYPTARPEISEDILQRTFALCPELAPPEIRSQRTPTIDDVRPLILEEGCGLRPGRVGGVKIAVELRGSVPVISHYGHAGSGYQSSWGSATRAVKLLEESLA